MIRNVSLDAEPPGQDPENALLESRTRNTYRNNQGGVETNQEGNFLEKGVEEYRSFNVPLKSSVTAPSG